jgi:cytochrome c biogenesis protein
MEKKSMGSAGPLSAIWNFFTSLRLTVILLLTLAITSVIGTLLPQNEDPAAYRQAFGEAGYKLLSFLDLFDMYHSWWFQLLLFLLAVNIVACSIHRLSALWKIIFTREPKFALDSFRSMENRVESDVSRNSEAMVPAIEAYLSRHFGYHIQQNSESGTVFFAEKWRWSRLGVYVVHLSIVLLLIGALIGSILGFEGYVNIPEGEATGTIHSIKTGKPLDLGFSIRCNDFDVSFYESGMPKEFRSSLSILEGNAPVITRDILVNDPLHFRGINIFQSSYGEMPPSAQRPSSPESVTLKFTSKGTSKNYSLKAGIGQTLQIPEDLGTLQLREVASRFNYRGNDLGPTLVATLVQKDGQQVEVILPVNFPTFDRMMQRMNPGRSDAVLISLVDIQAETAGKQANRYYTGLQVTKDPGVAVVYAGFILLLAGCAIAFFMSHQQVCIEVSPLKNKTRIAISGKTNRSKPGMRRKVEEIRGKLQSIGEMSEERDTL